MNNKLTHAMIDHLNLKLKDMGSSLKYVKGAEDIETTYKLIIDDMFVENNKYGYMVNTNDEFDIFVREFFKTNYNVIDLGFSNTVHTIFAINN